MNKSCKSIAWLAAAVMAAGVASAPALAHTPADAKPAADTRHAHAHQRGGHSHKDKGGRLNKREGLDNLRGLNLTQAQRDKIFEIRHTVAPETRQVYQELADARRALRTLSRAETFDEAKVSQAANRQGAAVAKAALLRARTQHRILEVLTPEQRQQLQQRQTRRQAPHSGSPHPGSAS